jgi:hypothetical protein
MKHILLAAKAEIEMLRRRNEVLEAKVSTMELFATVLHTMPYHPSRPEGVDVAWELSKAVEQIESGHVV